ncbi:hypothetical protein DQ353_18835 [Arthrobacter sp. AQ5-05]|uniref:hypothetical protein n=1 Tax=Arthrobacter sp. AQ5-05 TaxID=2184581 RepID=UPI000DCAF7B6|nr:hypothetical protein [Arthrobacter sp. AQ5-05]RAX47352.1 hypothetical protein DQ353_18835 [Arthrobacter sp. AQ5-05]
MPAEEQVPRHKKPRRFTAPPQQVSESTLVGVFEMPHASGRPAANAPGNPESRTGPTTDGAPDGAPGGVPDGQPQAASGTRTPKPARKTRPPKTGPVLEQRATEDDPRRWGDADDDLGDWMKAQRPPHWD